MEQYSLRAVERMLSGEANYCEICKQCVKISETSENFGLPPLQLGTQLGCLGSRRARQHGDVVHLRVRELQRGLRALDVPGEDLQALEIGKATDSVFWGPSSGQH